MQQVLRKWKEKKNILFLFAVAIGAGQHFFFFHSCLECSRENVQLKKKNIIVSQLSFNLAYSEVSFYTVDLKFNFPHIPSISKSQINGQTKYPVCIQVRDSLFIYFFRVAFITSQFFDYSASFRQSNANTKLIMSVSASYCYD